MLSASQVITFNEKNFCKKYEYKFGWCVLGLQCIGCGTPHLQGYKVRVVNPAFLSTAITITLPEMNL